MWISSMVCRLRLIEAGVKEHKDIIGKYEVSASGPRRRALVASNSCRYIQPDEQPLRRSYLMVGRLTQYVYAIKIVRLQFDSSDSNYSKLCIVSIPHTHILAFFDSSLQLPRSPIQSLAHMPTALAQHHRRDPISNAWSGWVIVVLRHA